MIVSLTRVSNNLNEVPHQNIKQISDQDKGSQVLPHGEINQGDMSCQT